MAYPDGDPNLSQRRAVLTADFSTVLHNLRNPTEGKIADTYLRLLEIVDEALKDPERGAFLLEQFGFSDAQRELFPAWRWSYTHPSEGGYFGSDKYRPYRNNLLSIIDIERERPGIARTLYDTFNTRLFGRDRTQVHVAQYDQINDRERPYGVGMQLVADHSGTFYGSERVSSRLLDLVHETHNLRMIGVNTGEDLPSLFERMHHMYGSAVGIPGGNPISFVLLNGHGTESSFETITSNDIGDLFRNRGIFSDDVTFILSSCNTGFGPDPIARHLSEAVPGATVIAPIADAGIKNLAIDRTPTGLKFDVRYWRGESVRFRDGERLAA